MYKKITLYILVPIFFVLTIAFVIGNTEEVYAQLPQGAPGSFQTTTQTPTSYDAAVRQTINATAEAREREEAERLKKEQQAANTGCSIFPLRWDACLQSWSQWLGNLILQVAAIFLWLAGVLLNWTLSFTLVNMNGALRQLTGINAAWIAIRDLANMFFIFVLLYIAISTILGLAEGHTKKLLAHVVIAALLINFSLFFTKIIVDASNIIAYGFYKDIPGVGNVFTGKAYSDKDIGNTGLSGSIMGGLRLQSIYDTTRGTGAGGQVASIFLATPNYLFATLGGTLFILITIIVFLVMAVMFIIRFVIIVFLLILSPLAFLSMVLPQLSEYSGKWWKTLLGQAIFAPAMMMMIWVTLKVAGGLKITSDNGTGSFADVLSGGLQTSFGIILNFAIIITMMIASLIIAKQIGSAGGHGLMAVADRFQGFLGRRAVRHSGLRRLDEKFGETKFGNTGFGSTLREYSTGALANAKFGGTKSAQEAYDEDTHLETERTEIGHRENFMKMVDDQAKGKPVSDLQIQRELSQITPHAFTLLPRDVLQDPKYMKFASVAQMQAVKDEHDGRLSEKEKHNASHARVAHHIKALEEYDQAYADWQNRMDTYIKSADPKLEGEALEKYMENAPKAPQMTDQAYEYLDSTGNKQIGNFSKTRKWLREMVPQEIDLLYWTEPDILQRKGASAWKFGSIDAIRKSQLISEGDKDVARGTKAVDFLTAENAYMGIDFKLSDTDKENLRDLHNLEHFEGETDLTVSNKLSPQVLEQLKKENSRLLKYVDENTGEMKQKYDITKRKFSEKIMREAYEGKNPTEILRMRGKHWQTPAVYKILGRDQMRDMNVNKDNGEKEPFIDFVIEEQRKEKNKIIDKATGKPYVMSDQTRSVVDWFVTNDRYAAEYLPGYRIKKSGNPDYIGKTFREILGVNEGSKAPTAKAGEAKIVIEERGNVRSSKKF